MTKKINLSNGGFALVDDEDFEWLNQWVWREEEGYVVRCSTYSNGKRKKIRMHRLIMGYPEGLVIDHINRIRHDNRKENLRICTIAQNAMNIGKNENLGTASKYKGVNFREETKCWRSKVRVYKTTIEAGNFTNEDAAANAYNYYAKLYGGEFASLNDVPYMPRSEWEKYKTSRKKAKITSKYRGVGWNIIRKKWRAYVGYKNKQYDVGFFEDEHEAAKARDRFIVDNGFDLPLNFT
ncbi:HNH endonuclease [Fictibacillus nanhaiensis]|uniref:HNH endonuclease n=1 Tax=Fictibacillus nanhaiensis TaxID=742169 RepID=UPI002E1C37F1|nr:HNH endonuclease [Fictibacillus nanhaiensis]